MKEYPLPLRAWEIRAILDGRKTQMRRPIKPQPELICVGGKKCFESDTYKWKGKEQSWEDLIAKNPYGKWTDHLWIQEAYWQPFAQTESDNGCIYKSDYGHRRDLAKEYYCDWIRSTHMPKWASRLTLEITNVRIERVTEISEKDAKAEGCKPIRVVDKFENASTGISPQGFTISGDITEWHESFSGGFQLAWDERYEKKYPWSSKPWAWCISFKKL